MKTGAFTQLYTHLVFAVQYRAYLLHDDIRPRIFEYVSGIVTDLKLKSIINGMPDHVHILLGWHPNVSISDIFLDSDIFLYFFLKIIVKQIEFAQGSRF